MKKEKIEVEIGTFEWALVMMKAGVPMRQKAWPSDMSLRRAGSSLLHFIGEDLWLAHPDLAPEYVVTLDGMFFGNDWEYYRSN